MLSAAHWINLALHQCRHSGGDARSGRRLIRSDLREGVSEWNGDGEAVGGIVVMRYGQNALNVINGIKTKIAEIQKSLPPGVEIVAGYDRAGLIQASINTLKRDLIEEAIIVSLVIIVFLFHLRSALIPILTLRWRCWPRSFRCTTSRSARTSCRWGPGIRDRRAGRCVDRHGRKWLSAFVGTAA